MHDDNHKPVEFKNFQISEQKGMRNIFATMIFASRWLQLPIYLGLIVTLLIYSYKFLKSLFNLVININTMDENMIMLGVLHLIDVVMIANLLVMVIIGGYEIFVSKLNTDENPDQPEWLNHVNASVLKVKLALSIVSISSIHLLQTFINVGKLSSEHIKWQLLLHMVFILSAVAMAYTDKLLYGDHKH